VDDILDAIIPKLDGTGIINPVTMTALIPIRVIITTALVVLREMLR
jgi:hypothetical protein